MKTRGQRKSKNMEDLRGPSSGYKNSSTAKIRDNRLNRDFGKSTKSDSSLAKEAGISGVDKISKNKKKLPTTSGNPYGGKSSRPRRSNP